VRLVVAALILLGFAARVWRIGYQSLWLDEALSVAFASPPLAKVFSTLASQDLHPPLYYLALHFWMKLAGQGEFAVRYVSLLFGLPAVPATYVLGHALFCRDVADQSDRSDQPPNPTLFTVRGQDQTCSGEKGSAGQASRVPVSLRILLTAPCGRAAAIGVAGAFLVAFSPFLVYYSQEARMYSALATFSVLSSYALWKLLATLRGRWLVAYVVFTAALLYTQYFGGLVVGFQAIYLLGLLTTDRRRALRAIVGMVLVGVAYLPWVPSAYLQVQRLFHVPDFWKGQLSLSFLLEHVFAAFAFGQYPVLDRYMAVAIVVAAVLLAGLAVLARQALRRGGGELFVLGYLLMPLAALYAILVQNPKFTERYLIMIAPPFYLVLALGLLELARWAAGLRQAWARWTGLLTPAIIAVLLLVTSFGQLWQVYYGPGYRKEDNRGATAYIEQHYQPGDVVILMMDPYSFPYYLHSNIPWVTLQPGNDLDGAASSLNAILAGHTRAWMLLWNADWADPTGYVRQSMATAYPRAPVTRGFDGLELKLFDLDHPPRFSVRVTPSNPDPVDFGNRLQLLGYDLPRSTIASGQTGDINLYWKPMQQLDHDYIVSLRLTDGTFYYWRHDGRPAADTYPTTSWPAGQVVTGDLPFAVPVGTPPGTYALEIGVYGQGVGSDLDVLKDRKVPLGTSVKVASVTVTVPSPPPDPSKIDLPERRNVAVSADLELLGSTLSSLRTPPGGTVDATLWWRAQNTPLPPYRIQLQVQNGSYSRTVVDEAPDAGTYATSRWTTGQIVVDKHRFVIPPDAPPGPARISLRVLNANGSGTTGAPVGSPVDLGPVTVLDRPVQLTPPPNLGTPVNWTFGTFARLVGFSLSEAAPRPGDHLALTLYWKALASSGDVGFTVFTHLLDQHGLIAAQQDQPPGGGNNPTSGWITGEYIVDHYDLAIKPDAAPGSYQIEVGMYNPSTGVRLPARGAAGEDTGDRVILATVQVK